MCTALNMIHRIIAILYSRFVKHGFPSYDFHPIYFPFIVTF